MHYTACESHVNRNQCFSHDTLTATCSCVPRYTQHVTPRRQLGGRDRPTYVISSMPSRSRPNPTCGLGSTRCGLASVPLSPHHHQQHSSHPWRLGVLIFTFHRASPTLCMLPAQTSPPHNPPPTTPSLLTAPLPALIDSLINLSQPFLNLRASKRRGQTMSHEHCRPRSKCFRRGGQTSSGNTANAREVGL